MAVRHETVAEMWASFARAVFNHHTPDVQRSECRRAFYAGCYGMLMACVLGPGDESVTEAEGVAHMEAWRVELEAFQKDVLEGRA